MGTDTLRRLQALVRDAWRLLRRLSGDDAYELYLQHCRRTHAGMQPLSRREFEQDRQERKWNRISRCC